MCILTGFAADDMPRFFTSNVSCLDCLRVLLRPSETVQRKPPFALVVWKYVGYVHCYHHPSTDPSVFTCLAGSIPMEFASLTLLVRVNLSGNSFDGELACSRYVK